MNLREQNFSVLMRQAERETVGAVFAVFILSVVAMIALFYFDDGVRGVIAFLSMLCKASPAFILIGIFAHYFVLPGLARILERVALHFLNFFLFVFSTLSLWDACFSSRAVPVLLSPPRLSLA